VKRSLFLLISLIVLTSLILSGCGPKVDAAAKANGIPDGSYIPFPANGKSVTGAWSQEPDSIAPYWTQMSYADWITQLTLAGLGEWDDQGNFVAELAAEVPTAENGGVSADGLTITWKLQSGLKWSDGQPITSADVKFTWETVMNPAFTALQTTGYNKISSIDTPDDTTAVIHFSELYPAWQTVFTQGPNNSGGLLPKHILEGLTDISAFIHWPTVSSGPWVITDWVAGDHMTLLPNPNFFKGRPKLDRIMIKFVPTPETALAALQTGDVDWYPDFSESDIPTVTALEPNIHLVVKAGFDFEHYFFNLGTTAGVNGQGISDQNGFCPFKDIRVRKAITLGINRKAIADTLLNGATQVSATQWPNSTWTNTSLVPDAYDMEGAKALLDEAGYTVGADGIRVGMCDGVETKLSFNFETTDKQIRVDAALAAQSDLAKIGIEFKPIHTPAGTFFASYADGGNMAMGKFDMAGYTTGFYPDPMTGVLDSYACNMVPSANNQGGLNNYHICDPTLDGLMNAVNASADPAVRKTALDAVQKHIFDNYYVVMMYVRANVYGYVDRFVPGPFSFTSNMNWNSEIWDVK
jgi:peptide/nickel transport system substrate-binding protein